MRMPKLILTAAACVSACLVLSAPAAPVAEAAKKKPSPPQRATYWGAWIGNHLTGDQPPWDMSAVDRFEAVTRKPLSLLQFAAPFADCSSSPCTYYRFPTYEMNVIRDYGAIPFFSWGSQSVPVPPDLNQPQFRLAAIAAGAHDAYLRAFAVGARDWAHPFFLRFNWEMNGNWFPWAEFANGNNPGDYIRAWRHVHDIFQEVGATNATWVWCPYAHAKMRFGALAKFYPGSAYVDWTCLDGFNWGNNSVNAQPWRSFDEIFARSYRTLTRKLAPKKPVMLAEFASGGSSARKAKWIRQMFVDLRTKYRRIRGLLWFEQIDRGVQWPISGSAGVGKAFRKGIRQRGFRPNLYSGLGAGPIRPPR